METVNKAELVKLIADESDLTQKDAETALKAVMKSIADSMVNNKKVVLVGWGSFEPTTRAAREGRNPKTGDVLTIPATKTIKFTVGSPLKSQLNG